MIKNRIIYNELLNQKDSSKISFLIGARQVGKTTLLNQLYEKLCIEGKKKGLFLDLDIFTNFEKVSSFENLLNTIKLNGYEEKQKDYFYLFLDEFQRYSDFSIILKNVFDNLKNVKIYASGSSSVKIKSQIQESLAGRKIINKIYPLTFAEYLEFQEKISLLEQIKNITKLKGNQLDKSTRELRKELENFMIFGSYPEVALSKIEKKPKILEGIFDLYIKKDLIEYLNIKKIVNVKKLIEFLAINHGQKIKYEDICQVSSLDYKEVLNYIEILEETFLIKIIRPFYKNKNKELIKVPKIYFMDSGVRNYFIKNFNESNLRSDFGHLFEGFVISELIKEGKENIKFWQNKNKQEVDLILEENKKIIPIEIKFKKNLKSDDEIGLKVFLEKYKLKKGYLVNLSTQEKQEKISFILPYSLNLFIFK
ncbi:MAG: ATP-binding protein [Nanoarchaeota archaeon]|nr:ATP-binding protein [Nanoarchaeota archaeon]MBU0962405.1 ATP-binding protein [Nanoarchaeota archaeon]